MAVIIVGDDPASHVYVRNKIKSCERLGIKSTHIEFSSTISLSELEDTIHLLNEDKFSLINISFLFFGFAFAQKLNIKSGLIKTFSK